jgi:hypothetical protein
MNIEVSIGEAVDKLSILAIKLGEISDPDKLKNISTEHSYLAVRLSQIGINETTEGYLNLLRVNKKLWQIEDAVREKEFKKEFDDEFIEIARSVYKTNEERSMWKKNIDKTFNSWFSEEKQYAKFE